MSKILISQFFAFREAFHFPANPSLIFRQRAMPNNPNVSRSQQHVPVRCVQPGAVGQQNLLYDFRVLPHRCLFLYCSLLIANASHLLCAAHLLQAGAGT